MTSRLARKLARQHFPHAYVVDVHERPALTLLEACERFPAALQTQLFPAETGFFRRRMEVVDVTFANTAIGLPPPRCTLVIDHRAKAIAGESHEGQRIRNEQASQSWCTAMGR
jgi:hypothetical protein